MGERVGETMTPVRMVCFGNRRHDGEIGFFEFFNSCTIKQSSTQSRRKMKTNRTSDDCSREKGEEVHGVS